MVEKSMLGGLRVDTARNKFEASWGMIDYPPNDFRFHPFIHSFINYLLSNCYDYRHSCLGDTFVSKARSISFYSLVEINKDQPNEKAKGYLFGACYYSKGIGCILAETQRQAEEWKSL